MNKKGIGLAVHYKPLHQLSYYKNKYQFKIDNFKWQIYYMNQLFLCQYILSYQIHHLIILLNSIIELMICIQNNHLHYI